VERAVVLAQGGGDLVGGAELALEDAGGRVAQADLPAAVGEAASYVAAGRQK
jgi:hypothetical protein